MTQNKEFAQSTVNIIGVNHADRFSPRMHIITTYANKLATSSLVVLMKCHVRVIIRLWFSMVTLNGTFQNRGKHSTADSMPTGAHMQAIRTQIMLLFPYRSMAPPAL